MQKGKAGMDGWRRTGIGFLAIAAAGIFAALGLSSAYASDFEITATSFTVDNALNISSAAYFGGLPAAPANPSQLANDNGNGTSITGGMYYNSATGNYMLYGGGGWVAISSGAENLSNASGILSLANGGTGANITASAGQVVWSAASTMTLTSGGAPGQVLTYEGAGGPLWTSVGGTLGGGTINDIPYWTASNALGNIPALGLGGLIIGTGAVPSTGTLTGANGVSIANAVGGITVGLGTVGVGNGGTGATSLTANGILFGNGSSAVQALPAMAAGGLIIGSGTGVAPSTGTLAFAANEGLSSAVGASGITMSLNLAAASSAGILPVGNGGTGASSLAGHGVLLMNAGGTAAASVTGSGSDVLEWNGLDWAPAALPSGSNLWQLQGSVVDLVTGTNGVMVQSTMTVEGNAFSVGASTLVVSGGIVSVGAAPSGADVFQAEPGSTYGGLGVNASGQVAMGTLSPNGTNDVTIGGSHGVNFDGSAPVLIGPNGAAASVTINPAGAGSGVSIQSGGTGAGSGIGIGVAAPGNGIASIFGLEVAQANGAITLSNASGLTIAKIK